MEKQNKGLIIIIIVLIICVVGLSGYILYDKIINVDNNEIKDKTDDNNSKEEQNNNTNKNISTPEEFITEISKTEDILENQSSYTVNYNDFSFTAYKTSEYNNIKKIIIIYKGKQINKDNVNEEYGFHTLKSYYFDENKGLYIITLLPAPVADAPSTYIIAFDKNGNIKIDESNVNYNVNVDTNEKTLTYNYLVPGGIGDCYDSSMHLNIEDIYSSNIIYKYDNNEIKEISKTTKHIKDLPKCEY